MSKTKASKAWWQKPGSWNPKPPARSARRKKGSSAPASKGGPGPLVWIGAGVAGWLVWSLTKPSTASAAESKQQAPGSSPSPTPYTPTPSSLPPTASALVRRGSSGPSVLSWQTTLVYGGYLPDAPSSRDSVFGPLTEAATKVFQQKAGIAVDGIVGPETRAAAQRLLSGV